jgi:SAM-dependent methyltransferase
LLNKYIRSNNIFQLFSPFLPEDHSHTITATYYPKRLLRKTNDSINVLDLGCGAGNSIDMFRKISSLICWFGIDVEDSPEGRNRTRNNGNFKTYDGVNLPYENDFFDFIYTQQVLEHVRYPDDLLGNVYRVLKQGGCFAGSVSYLEPYHSYSIYNFTPHGLIVCLRDAGFDLLEIRPGIDVLAMIVRQMLNAPRWLNWFINNASPFDIFVNLIGILFGMGHKEQNFLKVQFAGQICFLAKKS